MDIVAFPVREIEGGTIVKFVCLRVNSGYSTLDDTATPGPEAHALALQMLQAASTLLRADNAGFDLSNELEITIGQLEMLIEEEK